MASLLSFIDIFGTGFQFTTFKKDKFKTPLGGIMTSLCLFTIAIFIYFFGKDFFFRKNPKILQQQVFPQNYSNPFILNQQNMPIIWRLDDGYNSQVNFTGIIYPKLTHYSFVNNASGSIMTGMDYLPMTKCSADLINSPELLNNLNLEEWYCLDWTNQNLTFGGGWDGTFIDYFSIELAVCEGSSFSSSENCTTLDEIGSFLNTYTGIYFDLYYPQFYFVPDDLENPMRIQYENYYFRLNNEMRKLDRLYFTNYMLEDDLGWIISGTQAKSLIASSEFKSDYMFYDDKNYGVAGQAATFYGFLFYFNKQYTMINRSYMKIQELIAIVGGFSNIILYAGLFLSKTFNIWIRDELLYNEFFEYIPIDKEQEKKRDEEKAEKLIPISEPNVSLSINLNPNDLPDKFSYQEKYESLLQNFKSLEKENVFLKEAIAKIKKEFISFKQKENSKILLNHRRLVLEQSHLELFNVLNKSSSHSISNHDIDRSNINISADLIINDSEEFKDNITCIICLGVVRNPLNCKECETTFCTKCINSHLIGDTRCPNCKQSFKHRNNKFLETIKLSCPSKSNESFALSDITIHLDKCEKRIKMFKCELCQITLDANGLEDPVIIEHNQNCKSSSLNCIYCNVSVKRQELDYHSETCSKRILQCSLCKTSYPADAHIGHDNYYCKISKFYKSIEEMIFKL